MRRARVGGIAAVVLCAWGCASPGGRGSAAAVPAVEGDAREESAPFTSPEELQAIARRPAPARVFEPREPEAPAWNADQAPAQPPAQAEHAPRGFWDGLVAAEAARRGGAVRLTEPMACLARLVGQYALEKEAPPGDATLAFLAARCGVADPDVGFSYVMQPLRGAEPQDELEQHMRPQAESGIRRALAGGDLTAGIWFGRQERRAVAMLVVARPLARLEALSATPGTDGRVIVRGELLRPAVRVEALINRGRYGYRRCALDPALALPRFAVECETDPADEEEVLEIAAFAPRRVMGPIVVRTIVWPRRRIPAGNRRPAAGPARVATAGGGPAAGLVASLNQVRTAAGLSPVALAPSQSETAVLLAPHFFAAQAGQQADQLDAIAVGVMAGWQVNGPVRAGHFTAGRTSEAAGEGGLIASVLERPSGREALLDPDIRAVAVGTVREDGRLGAVFGSYAFLDPFPPGGEAAAVARRIDEARALRGLPPALAHAGLSQEVAEIARSVERGERSPRSAMQVVLDRVSRAATSGKVWAWSGWAERLDRLELPEEVVGASAIQVAVGVAHCKPKGSPWFGYCVLVGAIQQGMTASAGRPDPKVAAVWPTSP